MDNPVVTVLAHGESDPPDPRWKMHETQRSAPRRPSRTLLRAGLLVLLPTAAFVVPAMLSAQAPAPDTPLPADPAVTVGELDNGLRYYVRENDTPENRADFRLVVNAGSILEDEDQLGLAHFAEHMAFNGTENFEKQELVDYLESIGMQFGPHINAYTSFDETVYMLRVPMDDPDVLETAFQILQDWAQAVLFDPEEVDKERGVVIEEWRLGRGAQARMRDAQFPVLFEGSLYADRLPIGKTEVLESAPASTLERFYRDWYRPDLMAVVAVGDFDGAAIEGMIRTQFAGLAGPAEPRPRELTEVPFDHPPRVAIAADVEAPQSQVSVLYKRPLAPRGTVGAFRRQLTENLYEGMMGGRLEELTQQAEPPFLIGFPVGGSFVRTLDMYQLLALVAEGGLERGLDALLTEAERVRQHGFTETEFARQKAEVLRSFERRFAERANQESANLAGRYVQAFLRGTTFSSPEDDLELANALLPAITLEDVNGLAVEWMQEQGRVVMTNAPEKDDLVTITEEDIQGVFASVAGKEIEPYVDAAIDAPLVAVIPEGSPVVGEEVVEEVGVTVWTLENGVRVVLRPTDFKDDEILFSATSPGGNSLAADEEFESIRMASVVVGEGGVGEFDKIALEKKLAGQDVRVAPSVGSLAEGISGSASPRDIETAFQLIYQRFMAPRKDETAFLAYKTLLSGIFANRGASPGATLVDTLSATMTQGHPRAVPPSEEMIERLDLDRSFAFYQDRFADASDFVFYFVGAFTPEELRPLVETWLGGLPSLGRVETWRDVGIDPPDGVIEKEVRKGLEPQSQTRIVFAGDAEYSLEGNTAISALADVLDIRLRELLREDLGGTYGVGVSGFLSQQPDEEYSLRISFGSAPERAEELTAVVFEEIDRIQQAGPDAETVEKVRETQRRNRETQLEQNRYWMGSLAAADRLGMDYSYVTTYEYIEGWTAEQVQEAALRYLRDDRYVKIVLYPENQIP